LLVGGTGKGKKKPKRHRGRDGGQGGPNVGLKPRGFAKPPGKTPKEMAPRRGTRGGERSMAPIRFVGDFRGPRVTCFQDSKRIRRGDFNTGGGGVGDCWAGQDSVANPLTVGSRRACPFPPGGAAGYLLRGTGGRVRGKNGQGQKPVGPSWCTRSRGVLFTWIAPRGGYLGTRLFPGGERGGLVGGDPGVGRRDALGWGQREWGNMHHRFSSRPPIWPHSCFPISRF